MTKDIVFAIVGIGILAAGLALLLVSRLRAVKDLNRPEAAWRGRPIAVLSACFMIAVGTIVVVTRLA